mgnify:CR=1 FL=1
MAKVAGKGLLARLDRCKFFGSSLPVIVVLDTPATLAVDVLAVAAHGLVGDNGQVLRRLVAEELLQQGTDNGAHSRGQNDNGDIVFLGPFVERLEARVQLHVLEQDLDTLVVGGLDRSQHFAEGITASVEH